MLKYVALAGGEWPAIRLFRFIPCTHYKMLVRHESLSGRHSEEKFPVPTRNRNPIVHPVANHCIDPNITGRCHHPVVQMKQILFIITGGIAKLHYVQRAT
jgi:hypothetical protein